MKSILSLCAGFAFITSSLATIPSFPHESKYAAKDVQAPGKRWNEMQKRQVEISNKTHPTYSYDQLYSLQTKFLDAFMYPNNQKEAKAINSSFFSEDVQGRVDITRTFQGRELNTEYIFGLFANLANATGFTLLGYPEKYEILHFAASNNIASASTRITFMFPALKKEIPLIIDTWNAFNSKGEIEMYDAVFKYWPWAFDSFFAALSAASKTTPEETLKNVTSGLAKSICSTHTQYCTGKNQQYNSSDACLAFLTNPDKVRFGKSYEWGRNTLPCRMVHQGMVSLRPDEHCSHIGPTGGGMCVDDQDYAAVVTDNYFTNSDFVVPPSNVAGATVIRPYNNGAE